MSSNILHVHYVLPGEVIRAPGATGTRGTRAPALLTALAHISDSNQPGKLPNKYQITMCYDSLLTSLIVTSLRNHIGTGGAVCNVSS